MNKGKLIIFEGIDACGKSTQIRLLKKKLNDYEIPVMYTREPSNGPIGKLIRREYLSGKRKENGGIINRLCEVDRIDHILNEKDGLLKTLKNGINVICDRYILSTIAYSLYNKIDLDDNSFSQRVMNIYNRFLDNQGIKPDLILNLKINVQDAIDRINSRKNVSIYEDSISKLTKINRSYYRSIEVLNDHCSCTIVSINGQGTKKDIANNIWVQIKSILDINNLEDK